MQEKIGRYLDKGFFIIFRYCYKIYRNIVNLQLTVFTIIFVYNKWKNNKPKPNLLKSLASTASAIIQDASTWKEKKRKSAQDFLNEKKKKNHH